MARTETISGFCEHCGFAIFVGWPHKCIPRQVPKKNPQDENKSGSSGSFLIVGRPKVRR
jgi:hypothetical protein